MARAIQRSSRDNGEIIGMFPTGMTVIVDVAVLFPGFGSGVDGEALTVTVFVTGPGVEGRVTRIVTVTEAPLASVAKVQVSVVVVTPHAPPGVAATKVVPGGKTSVTVTFVAVFGPPFVAIMV